MATRTVTSYEIIHDGNTFPVDIEPISGTEVATVTGNKARVGWLAYDLDRGGDYFSEYEEGEFLNFDRHMCNPREMVTPEELAELVKANPGRVFWINKYDHSGVLYYRSGDALVAPSAPSTEPAREGLFIPDQQWDVSRGVALYVAPDDCPDPAEYCDSTMTEFSDWRNGSIYGVCTQSFKRRNKNADWVPDGDGDECWGHIGFDHAKQALAEEMK